MSHRANAARHQARRLLIQALYQWQISGDDPGDVLLQFLDERDTGSADREYFRDVMRGITGDAERVDSAIAPLLERTLAMVDPVERAVVRLAAYELLERLEIPARVVIDEAVELAREFGSEQGHRFVNGLIDRLAHRVRIHEFGPAARSS
jgi:transcription antitermination protein NusB